jgi:type II restriction/modification system DNA methylase subunit YeeA
LTAYIKGQRITTKNVLGIEINPYAAELARVTVWIGELQWQLRNDYGVTRQPILGALDNIENRDALRNEDGSEAAWPKAAVIIGNPPFLGGKLLRRNLRDKTVDGLFELYRKRVPPEADLVCYWFAKALDGVVSGGVDRVGLVATNSIRGGANRVVLDRVELNGRIFEAWSDEPWILNGAAVRVSLVCFDGAKGSPGILLDGRMVKTINTDLTSTTFLNGDR